MKIFVAIGDANLVPRFYEKTKLKLNYLVSYAYLEGQAVKLTKQYRSMINELFLDSGAFTSSMGRTIITISEYLKYLKRYGKFFDAVFNLDDDFTSPEQNYINQIFLEKGLQGTGVRPVPVVHDPENPFDEFQKYADQGHTFIAIGSFPKITDENMTRIKNAYPRVRLHMFGNLVRKMLFKFKPYSADSGEYFYTADVGNIQYWDPKEKKEHEISTGGKEKAKPDAIHFNDFELRKDLEGFLLKTFNFTYEDVLHSDEARFLVNCYFVKQLEDAVNQS